MQRSGEKEHIEAENMYFRLAIREPLLNFLAFSENDPLPYRPNFPGNRKLGVTTRY